MTECVTFGIIIDDIVFPDGRTSMGVLGGGGPQTAFGMRLISNSVGLSASVNESDLPLITPWLVESDIQDAGIILTNLPTPRAWQLLEDDGRRTQLWRVPGAVIGNQLKRSIQKLPLSFQQAKGFHFGIHPDEPDMEFIQMLHTLGGLISIEPFRPADRMPARDSLRQLLELADIISVNETEAQSLVGESTCYEQVHLLLDAGAKVAVVRIGEKGSLVGSRQEDSIIHIPAVPVSVVDPVGAGNAYCGAFLAYLTQSQDLGAAGAAGAAAASFLVEQVGVPASNTGRIAQYQERVKWLESRITKVSPGAQPFD